MLDQRKTVGQYLQEKRESEKISLETVSRATRVSPAFLQALEEDSFQLLPSETYARGFIQSYAKFIHLDPAEVLERYRNQVESSNDQVREKVVKPSAFQSLRGHLLDFLATIVGGEPTYSISKSVLPPKG